MIVQNRELQALECSICGELTELMRKVLGDPHALLELKEQLTEEHKPCEEYRDNPGLAAAARKANAELKRVTQPAQPRRRCRTYPQRGAAALVLGAAVLGNVGWSNCRPGPPVADTVSAVQEFQAVIGVTPRMCRNAGKKAS